MTLSLRDDDLDLAHDLPSALHHQQELVGISGWLALAALGVIVAVVRPLIAIVGLVLASASGWSIPLAVLS